MMQWLQLSFVCCRKAYGSAEGLDWDEEGGGVGLVLVAGKCLVGCILVGPSRTPWRLDQDLHKSLGAIVCPASNPQSSPPELEEA